MRLGMGRPVHLEALPVVRQAPGEEDLAAQLTRARIGLIGARPLQGQAALRVEPSFEGSPKVREEISSQGLKLLTVLTAVRFRRRPPVPLAELDEQVERRHFHGLLDALRQLGVDALEQAAAIVRPVAEPGGPEGVLRHGASSMRLSPCARGSGVIPKSA